MVGFAEAKRKEEDGEDMCYRRGHENSHQTRTKAPKPNNKKDDKKRSAEKHTRRIKTVESGQSSPGHGMRLSVCNALHEPNHPHGVDHGDRVRVG
jgi:hypothetical protein